MVRRLLRSSPLRLFVMPGILIVAVGVLVAVTVLTHLVILGRAWETHALIGGFLLVTAGSQILGLGLCAQAYCCYFLGMKVAWFEQARAHLGLEHGLVLGSTSAAIGCIALLAIVLEWVLQGFGDLAHEWLAMCAATLVVLGVQTIFVSFLLNVLGLRSDG